ncbi:FemAB family PEP-CTERM system-associated protein [Marinobacteraceae bacterium S3BR75-40.1]
MTKADDIKKEVEQLKERKGQLSREIGALKSQGTHLDSLIKEMTDISAQLKRANKALKKELNKQDSSKDVSYDLTTVKFPFPERKAARVLGDARSAELREQSNRFVDAHPLSAPYHRMDVRDFIEETYGHTTNYLCAVDETGGVIGVLPLVQLKSRLFGNFIVSVPYFNYGGVLANNHHTASLLVEEAVKWARELQVSHMEMRPIKDSGLQWPQRTDKCTFWLKLPPETDALWRSFKPKVRAQIRRPASLKPEVVFGKKELLPEFYRVFSANMRDLGTPVYSKRFFAKLLDHFTDTTLVVVRLEGKAVGCAFLWGGDRRLEIPWASTLKSTNKLGINMYMYWRILQHAIEKGFDCFDFGRCTIDSGTYKFKKQWGAEPVQLHWDYWLAEGQEMPKLNPDNPKYRMLINIWQRLPVWVTQWLGPPVVKYLP